VVGYVVAGVGLTLGVGALVHNAWNRERYGDWKAEHRALQADPRPDDYAPRQLDNDRLAQSVNDASRVTVGLGIGAAALAVSGAVVAIWGDSWTWSAGPGAQALLTYGHRW
jgi:hypothetical protein